MPSYPAPVVGAFTRARKVGISVGRRRLGEPFPHGWKATRHQVCLEDGVKVNKALIWSTPAFCWENLPWTVRPQKYLQELKVNMKAQWSAQRGTSGPESGNNLNPTVIGFKSLGCWKEGTPFRVIYLYDLCSFWRNGEWNGKSATGCSVIHSSAATLPKALSSRTLLNVQSMEKRTISHCPLPNPLRLFVVCLQLAKWQLCRPPPPPWNLQFIVYRASGRKHWIGLNVTALTSMSFSSSMSVASLKKRKSQVQYFGRFAQWPWLYWEIANFLKFKL